jgi:hypothetical protein
MKSLVISGSYNNSTQDLVKCLPVSLNSESFLPDYPSKNCGTKYMEIGFSSFNNQHSTCITPLSKFTVLLMGLSLASSLPNDKLQMLEESWSFKPFFTKTNLAYDNFSELESQYIIDNHTQVKNFVLSHELTDFLLWITKPIVDIFGDLNKALHLFKCWDEEDYHLVLSIFSGLDDMDKISDKEVKLFHHISENKKDNFLDYVVIAQR